MGAEKCGWKMIYACSMGSPGKSAAQDPQEDPGQPREAAHKEAKQTSNSGDLSFNGKCHELDDFNPSTNRILAGDCNCHRRERDEEHSLTFCSSPAPTPWTGSRGRRRGDIFPAAFSTAQPRTIVQGWQCLHPGVFPTGNRSLSGAIPPASKCDTFSQRARRAQHQLPNSGKAAVLKHPWIESLSPWRSRDMPNPEEVGKVMAPSSGMPSPSRSQLPGSGNIPVNHALVHPRDSSHGMAPAGSSRGSQALLAVAQGVVHSPRGARWQRCQLRQDIYLLTHTTARGAPGPPLPPRYKSHHSLSKSLSGRIPKLLKGVQ